MTADYKFWAFISYSHQDNRKTGNTWGDWLHDSVENFKVPPEIVGKPGRHGEAVPARLFPAFQDEKELPTNADLGEAIHEALVQSRCLVVICSPRAARSIYVNQEILEFKRLGRANRILAIIVDGEPNASEPGKGFDPALECFPQALRHPLDEHGNLDLSKHAEPIAADVRDSGGHEASLRDKAHQSVLEREKLRVIAGLLGIGFDDLAQRDKERQLREARARARRLWMLAAVFGFLAMAATVAGIMAFIKKREADTQRLEAIHQQQEVRLAFSKADCAAAVERMNNQQAPEAVAFLCRALRTDPHNAQAGSLLFSVLNTRNWAIPLGRMELGAAETFLAFDADGTRALTRTGTNARVWDLDAHRVVREIPNLTFSAVPPMFSPDGRFLILSIASSLQKLEFASGAQSPLGNGSSQYDNFTEAFRLSPDGKSIALAQGNQLQAWRLATNQQVGGPVKAPANPYDGMPAAISHDGTRILHAWNGGSVTYWDTEGGLVTRDFERQTRKDAYAMRVWDVATGKPLPGGLTYSQTRIHLASFSPDGQWLMAATMDDIPNVYNTIRIWNASTGAAKAVALAHDANIAAANWSADGRHIVTACRSIVRIWDADTGALAIDPMHAPDDVLDAWFSASGSRVTAAIVKSSGVDMSDEPGLRMYALRPGGPTKQSFYEVKMAMTWNAACNTSRVIELRHGQWVLDAQFSPDGLWIAATSGKSATIWSVADHSLQHTLAADEVPVCIAFSADSQRLLVVSQNETARVWNVVTGQAVTPPIHDAAEDAYSQAHNNRGVGSIGFAEPAHPPRKPCGALSRDGKRLALASGFSARIWDAATGKPLTPPLRHDDYVHYIHFSTDGRILMSASLDAKVRLWDVATAKPIGQPIHPDGHLLAVTLSPDGECVATAASDITTQVWNVRTGRPASPAIKEPVSVKQLEFSADGKQLLIVAGNSARVWNAVTGETISAAMHHAAPLTSATFSRDGKFVLTASEDRSARIWSAATGLPASVPMLHSNAVNVASFSADGQTVVSADEDGTMKLWPFYSALPPPWILDFAEALAGRSLDNTGTPAYLPGKPADWLIQQARQEADATNPMVIWARKVLIP